MPAGIWLRLNSVPHRAPSFGRVSALFCTVLLSIGATAKDFPAPKPGYGLAVLASDIGHDYPVAQLAGFIEQGGFAPVIIDWAWITYHWEKTDFAAVRQLVIRLKEKNIEVAAMYRPRFLGNPTVPEQVHADGSPAPTHGHYPCFSSSAARQWSLLWGERILEKCPEFEEIVIYNPLDLCQCRACRRLKSENPYAGTWAFLREAKHAWQTKKPSVELGVVFNPAQDFWLAGKDVVDVARPFFHVREDADMAGNAREIGKVQRILGRRTGACLAKVTWGPEDTISLAKLSEFARVARDNGLTSVLWTFDTLFLSPSYEPAKVTEVLGLDYGTIALPVRKLVRTAQRTDPAVANGNQEDARTSPANRRTGVLAGTSHPALTFPTVEAKAEKLPWPHQAPGLSAREIEAVNRDVWVINNNPLYQADDRGEWCYLHGGLDIVLTNGAKIYAMKDGWVKVIAHSTITVADAKDDGPSYGWSYAHLGHFRVSEGDAVKAGTLLGEVDFNGLPHLHLDRVFSQGDYWRSWRYICFPDDHFTFEDDEPPTIERPFYFFEHDSDRRIQPQRNGSIAVRGDIDIVVAMRDGGQFAHSRENGFGDRLAVTRIEYSIHPAGKETEARHFHSFDFRKLRFLAGTDFSARSYNTALARTVYKHWALFGKRTSGHQNHNYYIISNCPGDAAPAELDLALATNCWHTAARKANGAPLYPDDDYVLEVTAYDSHENRAARSVQITVDNGGRLQITAKEPGGLRAQVAGNSSAPPRGQQASPEDIRRTSVEEWFRRIGRDGELGYSPFTALNALIDRAKENAANRDQIVRLATEVIDDKQQDPFRRWQCCYVLSGIGDPRGIPPVIRALNNQNEIVRSVAACALGQFDHPDALSALRNAAKTEKVPKVQEEIQKALRGAYRGR